MGTGRGCLLGRLAGVGGGVHWEIETRQEEVRDFLAGLRHVPAVLACFSVRSSAQQESWIVIS